MEKPGGGEAALGESLSAAAYGVPMAKREGDPKWRSISFLADPTQPDPAD